MAISAEAARLGEGAAHMPLEGDREGTPFGTFAARLFTKIAARRRAGSEDALSPAAVAPDDVATAILLSLCLHILLASPWWLTAPEPEPLSLRIALAPPAKSIAAPQPLGTQNGTERLKEQELPPLDEAGMAALRAGQGKRINACMRCTLTRGDFSGGLYRIANLRHADMREANLEEADFSASRLMGANLSRANLRGTRLQGALLTGADLRLADLTNARMLGVWIEGADFTGANLTGADMTEIDMADKARFREAVLHDADLRRSNLAGMDFYKADLSGADLRYGKGLTQAQLDYACGDTRTRLPEGLTIRPCANASK